MLGKSEELIGETSDINSDIVVYTKVYTDTRTDGSGDLTFKAIEESVQASLQRLQRPKGVNVLYVYRTDPSTPLEEQILGFNHQFSHGRCQAADRALHPAHNIVIALETGEHSIDLSSVYEPLAAGFLTGKYIDNDYAGLRGDGIIIGASRIKQFEEMADMIEKGPLPKEVFSIVELVWNMVKEKGKQRYSSMAPMDWPRPPNIDGLPTDDAVTVTQDYVKQVQDHVNKLRLDSTDCGVLIGFMLSTLDNAIQILNVVYQDSNIAPDVRNDIEQFDLAMQSLASYMSNTSVASKAHASPRSSVKIEVEDTEQLKAPHSWDAAEQSNGPNRVLPGVRQSLTLPVEQRERSVTIMICDGDSARSKLMGMTMDQLKAQLVQDFHDQGISVPLLSCHASSDCRCVHIFTSSKYYAVILRSSSFWEPTLFGENACVMDPLCDEDIAHMETTLSFKDVSKLRKAKEKARTGARVAWITLPDREFAKAELMGMDNTQLQSRVERELQAQGLKVRIQRCKKSHACTHIRLWTVDTTEVDILTKRWRPMHFGKGACVRWTKRKDFADITVSISPSMIKGGDEQGMIKSDGDEMSVDLSGVPLAGSWDKQTRKDPQEVFIRIPDRQFAKTRLLGLKQSQLRDMAQNDVEGQGISVRILSCHVVQDGTIALLRTKRPEGANFLKQPGTWTPNSLGDGAHVVV
ncbi:MAG: hypothetical protein Q9218_006894 [Villophora microphyllina]